MRRSLSWTVWVFIITCMLLAACGPSASTLVPATAVLSTVVLPTQVPAANGPIPFPSGGKSITGAWSQEPDNIVPYYSRMKDATRITQLTLAGLGEWDDKGNFVPELASDVPSADNGGISPDGLTITWKLKPGLQWSDGEPLTSADVLFTWQFVMDPKNSPLNRAGYDKISSIDTPDAITIVLHFGERFPAWQTLFTQGPDNAGAILPGHVLQGKTALEDEPFIHWPTVASGPWIITEWVAGDHMTLLPNPYFYSGRPKLDRIKILFVPDTETALAMLQTGDADWYPDFSESDISSLTPLDPAIHLLVKPGTNFEQYFFNLGTTAGVTRADGSVTGQSDTNGFCPFKDVRVRKAITLGIERQVIADGLLNGATEVPATQWPNSAWTDTSLTAAPYDPQGAKALLEEAGYTPDPTNNGIRHGLCEGKDVKLSINFETTEEQIRMDAAAAVQSDLAKIGIEFKPILLPTATFLATYSNSGPLPHGNFDMAGYPQDFSPDPMWGVMESYSCAAVPSAANPGGGNYSHLCDPKLDQLMNAVNASVDPAVRKVALDALQKYIFDQTYGIIMYVHANVYGYGDRFIPGPFSFTSDMDWNSEVWDVKTP
ncbi:MAG: peptide ABC transporter substrate-binding protein [Anaerolineales bacterium]